MICPPPRPWSYGVIGPYWWQAAGLIILVLDVITNSEVVNSRPGGGEAFYLPAERDSVETERR